MQTPIFAIAGLVGPLSESAITALIQAGILGPFVVLLMMRDVYLDKRRDSRVSQLCNAVTAHDAARDKKIEKMLDATNNLIRSHLMEVMSRPTVAERHRSDVETVLRSLDQR